MNRGKIYLTIDDLMKLTGAGNKTYAYEAHRLIREEICPGKKSLTILEYCQHSGENYEHIYFELRGELPDFYPKG